MAIGLITFILVDAILFIMIRLVHTEWQRKGQSVPMTWAVGLFFLSCLAHFGATKTLGRAVTSNRDALVGLGVCAGFGFVPIWAYVHMLLGRVVEQAKKQHGELYPLARKLRVEGDIEGALREYLKYYGRDEENAGPLFSAASMLEEAKDFEKAAKLFRQIMERFEGDEHAWTKAGFRLAFLCEHHIEDPNSAQALRSEIVGRIPPDIRAEYQDRDLKASQF